MRAGRRPPPSPPDADDALQVTVTHPQGWGHPPPRVFWRHLCVPQAEVVTLAQQIIEATPERIKQEAPGGPPGTAGGAPGTAGGGPATAGGPLGTPGTPGLSAAMAWLATYLESVDRLPTPPHRCLPGLGETPYPCVR